MTDIRVEDSEEFMQLCRATLSYPAGKELEAADVCRAMELLAAETRARELLDAERAVLEATADVLERSFIDIADEYNSWPDSPPEASR